jgi:hypothetical protein
LTILSGSTAIYPVAAPKKKRNLLPLLTVVFVISYVLMTMLIIEQGAAIQSQSNLIKVLMPDSRELWGLKGKALVDKAAKGQAAAHTEAPAAQAPADQTQAKTGKRSHAQSHVDKAVKPPIQFPPIPASDLDPQRTVRTI